MCIAYINVFSSTECISQLMWSSLSLSLSLFSSLSLSLSLSLPFSLFLSLSLSLSLPPSLSLSLSLSLPFSLSFLPVSANVRRSPYSVPSRRPSIGRGKGRAGSVQVKCRDQGIDRAQWQNLSAGTFLEDVCLLSGFQVMG